MFISLAFLIATPILGVPEPRPCGAAIRRFQTTIMRSLDRLDRQLNSNRTNGKIILNFDLIHFYLIDQELLYILLIFILVLF